MHLSYVLLLIILALAGYITVKSGKLTVLAAVSGCFISLLLFASISYIGLVIMAAFFAMATIATAVGMNQKRLAGLAENEKGTRTSSQVLANGGAAGLLSIPVLLYPDLAKVCTLMIAASFAAAAADTLSSELGNVYGRRFYNILTFKKDSRGLDGVVSLEGTLAGLIGSIVIAMIYAVYFGMSWSVFIITAAGTIGNISDSYLGATLERSKVLHNNAVNFLNTSIAAITALILYKILGH